MNKFSKTFVGQGYDELFAKRQGAKKRVIIKGSKNSKKSFSVAFYIIFNMLRDTDCNIMVLRKNRADNLETTFSTLRFAINKFIDTYPFYHNKFKFVKAPEPKITFYNHLGKPQNIYFESLDRSGQKLSGIVPEYGSFKILWIEEPVEASQYNLGAAINNKAFIHELSVIENSLDRSKDKKATFETVFTFNPWCGEHTLVQELGENLPDDEYILSTKGKQVKYVYDKEKNISTLYMTTNYLINEFLKDSAKAGIELEKKLDYDRYLVSGLGMTAPILNDPFELYRDNITFDNIPDRNFIPAAIGLDIGSFHATTLQVFGTTFGIEKYNQSIIFKGEYYHNDGAIGKKENKKGIDRMAQEVAMKLKEFTQRWIWRIDKPLVIQYDKHNNGESFMINVFRYLNEMGVSHRFKLDGLIKVKNIWNIEKRVQFWFNLMSIKGFLVIDGENFQLGKTLGFQKIDNETGVRIDENMDAINAAEYAIIYDLFPIHNLLYAFKENKEIDNKIFE